MEPLKICHFIWDRSPLAFLNAVSVWSFKRHNPEWQVWLWIINTTFRHGWLTTEHKELYDGYCYMEHINKDVDKIKTLAPAEIHPTVTSTVHLSDLLRYQILKRHGGLYSDFDILYLKPLPFALDKDLVFANWEISKSVFTFHWPVALFYAHQPESPFWTTVVEKAMAKGHKGKYQHYGVHFWNELLPTKHLSASSSLETVMDHLQSCAVSQGYDLAIENGQLYLPVKWNETKILYSDYKKDRHGFLDGRSPAFAIHWFNGDAKSKTYLAEDKLSPCLMTFLLAPYLDHAVHSSIFTVKALCTQIESN